MNNYDQIRSGGRGFYGQERGLIAVWGKEAVQFLDGLITNDMKTLKDGGEMLAAFPNAQGRLLTMVRVVRLGEKYLFETEAATREKLFQNLFRFTYAGDFLVEDVSDQYRYFELFGSQSPASAHGLRFSTGRTSGFFEPAETADTLKAQLIGNGAVEISDDDYEVLRVEMGVPRYGVDMDETTIVPELGIEGLISYNKGCYIGQEIIARIHFRGHIAKQLTGLVSEPSAVADGLTPAAELTTSDGKNAGRITSVTLSPNLNKVIALAYVRYDYLGEGTELLAGEQRVVITALPFISNTGV